MLKLHTGKQPPPKENTKVRPTLNQAQQQQQREAALLISSRGLIFKSASHFIYRYSNSQIKEQSHENAFDSTHSSPVK